MSTFTTKNKRLSWCHSAVAIVVVVVVVDYAIYLSEQHGSVCSHGRQHVGIPLLMGRRKEAGGRKKNRSRTKGPQKYLLFCSQGTASNPYCARAALVFSRANKKHVQPYNDPTQTDTNAKRKKKTKVYLGSSHLLPVPSHNV